MFPGSQEPLGSQQKLPKTPQTLKPPYHDHLTHTHPLPTSSTPMGSPCFPLFGMMLGLGLGAGPGDEELDGHLHCQKRRRKEEFEGVLQGGYA